MGRPLRFGIITITNAPWQDTLDRWLRAEELGLDSAWTCDHLADRRDPSAYWLEGQTLLAALAARTRRIRLGCLVLSMTHRNAAVIARQAITIDHVSDGRLELGIGSGGSSLDHRIAGVPEWTPKERAVRFDEWARLLDRLLREPVPERGADFHPRALQAPRPPLTIGGQGPTVLRLAAELGGRWNTYGGYGLSRGHALAAVRENNSRLDEHCQAIGRDPREVSRSLLVGAAHLVDEAPFQSVEAFHDVVGRYRDAGIDEFVFYDPPEDWGRARPGALERVLTEALPAYRSSAPTARTDARTSSGRASAAPSK